MSNKSTTNHFGDAVHLGPCLNAEGAQIGVTECCRADEPCEAHKREEFIELSKPLIKFLCDNFHPHVTVIVTPTYAELVEGLMSTGEVLDYVRD